MYRIIFVVAAILGFFVGAMLSFGWFGNAPNPAKALGFVALGLIALTVALFEYEGARRGP